MHSSVRHNSEGGLGEVEAAAEQEQHSLASAADKLSFLAASEDVIFIWLLLIDFASVILAMVATNITHKNKEEEIS